MTPEERKAEIFARADEVITKVRSIRNQAQKNKRIDPEGFADAAAALSSMRHHCEMLATEG